MFLPFTDTASLDPLPVSFQFITASGQRRDCLQAFIANAYAIPFGMFPINTKESSSQNCR
jgi:hypothetical protein